MSKLIYILSALVILGVAAWYTTSGSFRALRSDYFYTAPCEGNESETCTYINTGSEEYKNEQQPWTTPGTENNTTPNNPGIPGNNCTSQTIALRDAQDALDRAEEQLGTLTLNNAKMLKRESELIANNAAIDKKIKEAEDAIKKITDALKKYTGFDTAADFDADYNQRIVLRDTTLPNDLSILTAERAAIITARDALAQQKKPVTELNNQIRAKTTLMTAKNAEITANKKKIQAMQSQNLKYVVPARQKIPLFTTDIERFTNTDKPPITTELTQVQATLQRVKDLPAEIISLTALRDAARTLLNQCNTQNPTDNGGGGNDGNNNDNSGNNGNSVSDKFIICPEGSFADVDGALPAGSYYIPQFTPIGEENTCSTDSSDDDCKYAACDMKWYICRDAVNDARLSGIDDGGVNCDNQRDVCLEKKWTQEQCDIIRANYERLQNAGTRIAI